jgi:hypothetical protein
MVVCGGFSAANYTLESRPTGLTQRQICPMVKAHAHVFGGHSSAVWRLAIFKLDWSTLRLKVEG